MRNILLIIMIVVSISLVAVILLQKGGSGVGTIFGGASEAYRTKRGAEKLLYYATIVLTFLFAGVSIGLLLT